VCSADLLFYGTGIPACVLVLRSKKQHPSQVYFVDASDVFDAGRNQNSLTDEQARTISEWYRDKRERPSRSRFVTTEELCENDWSLYPALYIWNDNALTYASKGKARLPLAPNEARDALAAAISSGRDAEEQLRRVLSEEGLS